MSMKSSQTEACLMQNLMSEQHKTNIKATEELKEIKFRDKLNLAKPS